MIRRLLIANRGEIACRIARTCRRMGIATVAVYSDADEKALHVRSADRAVRIGPPPPLESYLNIPAIVAAAKQAGADAVHPGYGFLAENADFAEACAAAGLVFVGPPAAAIRAMGSKAEARVLMARAGVPILPGYQGAVQDDASLAREAAATGYPVLIKPSAGGGGRGMRVVRDRAGLDQSLAAARREAKAAFADDRLILERYVERPRHVEVQIFGDSHGAMLHLFERDCSLQRRHQKVIEEAPAPNLSEETRATLHEAACDAARAVAYVGAGTVEFLVDEAGRATFMEMNTRLQVEHGVTEAILGVDLVEWQLRVAAGEKLPVTQDALRPVGHAIEARLCAEDPERDFVPSSGTLIHFRLPTESDAIRVDTGFEQGDTVPPDYDSLLAKIIAHGPDRDAARRTLVDALAEVETVGVATNEAFLAACVRHKAFAAADIETGFVDRHRADLQPPPSAAPPDVLALAALFLTDNRPMEIAPVLAEDPFSPWARQDGWRLGAPRETGLILADGGQAVSVAIRAGEDVRRITVGAEIVEAREICVTDDTVSAVIDGAACRLRIVPDGDRLTAFADGRRYALLRRRPDAAQLASHALEDRMVAPMPGVVRAVLVQVGDRVAAGDPVVVIEAMKVEHTVSAPCAGTITALPFQVGDRVAEGALVAEIEPET